MNAPYPANWIKERLGDWASEKGRFVGSLVPEGFEAYARVFHPAKLWKADRSWEQVRWSTVASWNGKVVHPQMQFCRIANLDVHLDEKPSWGRIPFYGMLPEDECQVLISVLKGFTSTPERCYFSLWHGYGFLDDRYFKKVAKLKVHAGRSTWSFVALWTASCRFTSMLGEDGGNRRTFGGQKTGPGALQPK